MKIIAISDLHGHLPILPECDVLCIAGDVTPDCFRMDAEKQREWLDGPFADWIFSLDCYTRILVAGNHDYGLLSGCPGFLSEGVVYLENEGYETMGFTFWGTPNVPKPTNNLAFYQESDELLKTFRKIPDKVDFLISHAAPYGANNCGMLGDGSADIGSRELAEAIKDKDIGYIFCGHIHTGNHNVGLWEGRRIVNVSYCNENKEPAYDPFYIYHRNDYTMRQVLRETKETMQVDSFY